MLSRTRGKQQRVVQRVGAIWVVGGGRTTPGLYPAYRYCRVARVATARPAPPLIGMSVAQERRRGVCYAASSEARDASSLLCAAVASPHTAIAYFDISRWPRRALRAREAAARYRERDYSAPSTPQYNIGVITRRFFFCKAHIMASCTEHIRSAGEDHTCAVQTQEPAQDRNLNHGAPSIVSELPVLPGKARGVFPAADGFDAVTAGL
ncbi:hypothetical protein PSPO01_13733 [Paraphaeosphaeria sporulosa]